MDAALSATDAWLDFAGALHPALVHFPIALGVVAASVEAWRGLTRRGPVASFSRTALSIAAATALVAAASGWSAPDARDGSESWDLFLHRWVGTLAALLLAVLALWVLRTDTSPSCRVGGKWRAALIVTVILVAGAGSLGGDLVHGEGHITDALWRAIDVTERSQRASAEAEARVILGAPPRESVPSPAAPAIAAQPSVAPAAELARHVASIDYATQVRPLLEAHCYECHGNGKKKGGVRLDDLERLTAERGGEWVVKPGDPQSSLLIKFVSLPEDDEDRMPPEGDSLTDDEVSLLRDWIREGARTESMLPSSPASAQSHAVVPLADSGWSAPERVLNVDEQSRVAAVASALVPRGVSVRPLAEACGFLEVDMSRAEPKADAATIELLMSVADLTISLNASRSDLDDASAGSLARLNALREVRLDFTRAGDSTAATLAALPHLHTANFVGTPLSDAGLALLAQSPSLRRVYVWSSAVTQDGIDAATRVNTRLRVVTSK